MTRPAWLPTALLLVFITSGAPARQSVVSAGEAAFVNVTVVPMDSERLIERQTVIVEGGVIVSIGPAGTTPVPADARIIEGDGRYLMPGLVDSHVHANNAVDPQLYLANGITAVRNLWGGPAHLGLRANAAASPEFTSPVVYTAGPLIDGEPPIWRGSAVATTAEGGRALVEAHADAGYDFIKVYSRLSAEAYHAILETARERGLPADGHVPSSVGLYAALEAGHRAIEHLRGYPQAAMAPSLLEGADSYWSLRLELALGLADGSLAWDEVFPPEAIAEVARATVAAGAWNIPTVTVNQNVAHDEYEGRARAPGTEYLAPRRIEGWNPANGRNADTTSDELRALRAFDQGFGHRMIAALHEAGAGLLVGTDTPNPFVLPGFAIHEELAHFVTAGLSPFETLERATRIPAEFMGMETAMGTVAVGKRADLILIDGNPLEDVGHVRELAGVMLRGRWIPDSEIHELLEQIRREVEGERDGD